MKKIIVCFLLFSLAITAAAQDKISRKAAMEDIDSLVSILERVHYNPYLYISRENFASNINRIKRSISDSIGFNDYLLLLYNITASLQDGHGMPHIVQPKLLPELRKQNFLPLQLLFHDTTAYTTVSNKDTTGIPHGSRIITINKIPVERSIKEFQSFFGGSSNYRQEMANRLFSYFLFLKGARPPFLIMYSRNGGRGESKTITHGVTFKEFIYTAMPHLKEHNSYKIIGNKLAYINFLSMGGNLNEWGSFLDSVFSDIRAKHLRSLCIDIRDNPGGNSVFGNYLLAYITKKKFLQLSGKCWKISDEGKRYQQETEGINAEYQSKTPGSLWCYESCVPSDNPVIADTVFDGQLYLLTGPFTFSSANMFADAFKTFHLGTILGQATGEYTNDFGETIQVILPNSHAKIQVTTSFEYGADCNKQKLHTVLPDITVNPSLNDKIQGTDIVLEHVLKIAKGGF